MDTSAIMVWDIVMIVDNVSRFLKKKTKCISLIPCLLRIEDADTRGRSQQTYEGVR